jgi:hypothetical protein
MDGSYRFTKKENLVASSRRDVLVRSAHPGYGALRNGGKLAAMRFTKDGNQVQDLSVFTEPGSRLQVSWIPCPTHRRPQRRSAPELHHRRLPPTAWPEMDPAPHDHGGDGGIAAICVAHPEV